MTSLSIVNINTANDEIVLNENSYNYEHSYRIIDSQGNPLRDIPWEVVNPEVAEEWNKREKELGTEKQG